MEKILSMEEYAKKRTNEVRKKVTDSIVEKYVAANRMKPGVNKHGKQILVERSKKEKAALRAEYPKSKECATAVEEKLAIHSEYQKYASGDTERIQEEYDKYVEKTEKKNKIEGLKAKVKELSETEAFDEVLYDEASKWVDKVIAGAVRHLKEDDLETDEFFEDSYDSEDYESVYNSVLDIGAYCEYIEDFPEEYVLKYSGLDLDERDIILKIADVLKDKISELKDIFDDNVDSTIKDLLIGIIETEFDDILGATVSGEGLANTVYENKYYLKANEDKAEAERKERERQEALKAAVITAMPEKMKDAYPLARRMKRKFVLHIGPTNSGKTFDALQAFREAKDAVYLAPLRLLALEVAENTNELGIACSMLTGEEENFIPGANHISETIEMADLTRHYSVAVIDEAQMINDRDRGGAWTAAILGLCADEIHICMAPHAESIVRDLIEYCGDEVAEVKKKERKTPLTADNSKFKFPKNVSDGDALIVFSKRSVLACAAELQNKGIPCSIIYGALPYETRKSETERFIKGETKVVVATDAIGMGLNLPVKRIIFMETEKYDGQDMRKLRPAEVQQIAGRAGRHGIYDEGFYNAKNGMPFITSCMNATNNQISHARLRFPEFLVSVEGSLSEVINKWCDIQTEIYFKKSDVSQQLQLCRYLENFEVEKKVIYRLINIPFNAQNQTMLNLWKMYAGQVVAGNSITLSEKALNPDVEIKGYTNNERIQKLEEMYQRYDLIYNFVRLFGDKKTKEEDKKAIKEVKRRISDELTKTLSGKKLNRRQCPDCGGFLAYDWPYRTCQSCYEDRRMERFMWW